MEQIIKTDYYSIYANKHNSIYQIRFPTSQYVLIQSMLKTPCLAGTGASTDELYKTITFKAESVKTLDQYIHEQKMITGRPCLSITNTIKLTQSLTHQLSHLITQSQHTIIGYNPETIIMINDKTSAFLGSEFIVEIDASSEETTIFCPFMPYDAFFSPEILTHKQLPMNVHYKTAYFSLACLVLYVLLGENEFYREFIQEISSKYNPSKYNPNILLRYLQHHPIKDTKLYWVLSRCLTEDPRQRSIIYL